MENEYGQSQDSVYSNKVKAGKRRTYFFDVKQTRGEDYYVTMTEMTRKFNGSKFTKHKIFLYKEDFNRFLEGLQDTINHIKTDLLPDYDYEQFDRRQNEWEQQKAIEESQASEEKGTDSAESESSTPQDKPIESEDDISW